MVQSDVSPDALTHFMKLFGGTELHYSPKTFDDRMLLAREFGHNNIITRLALQRDFPRREGNVHELLQDLDRSPRGTIIEGEFQSIRDRVADMQGRLSVIIRLN
jgi:hypothetical protein